MTDYALTERDYAWGSRSDERARSGDLPRSAERAAARSGARAAESAGRAVRAAAVAAAAVAALAVAAYFVLLPLTAIRRFEVTGARTLSADELRAWSGLPEKAHWFDLDCAAIAANVSANPRVASAEARGRFPGTVVVSVVERAPMAIVYARAASGRMEAHCVDGDGVVFAPASDYPESRALPVLSGLEIRGLGYGLRLKEPFTTVLSSMAAVLEANPALIAAVSEFRVVSREGSAPELVVYPANYRLPVRMRPALNAGLLQSMMLILDVVEAKGLTPSIRELDLRTDTFVYRTKEAVSG